ncbi:hypothetical protein [Vitiosangium sp. GDMCC 1.1324]|uniref:hypothetical protein n=1 Tax=Vitiosangium sp. (strain GDMCC 1.1324) TaxID=2138576 RepID=UPI000D385A3C|nr:hypothetical protein [Vitiosangium sp. GDMCC 1.1324]PTL82933.1 hypothetical protein DAT35_12950 [Vitiosangium sp. GDMCC 1.1324]
MRRLIWGALWGVVVLAGCRTDGTVAMRKTPGSDGTLAKNPYSLERGFTLKGTVAAEYSDVLVIKDKWGKTRYLRITDQTRYYQSGKQIGREFLAPGSSVRASFANQDTEMIAREITIVEDVGKADPLQLPDRTNTVP